MGTLFVVVAHPGADPVASLAEIGKRLQAHSYFSERHSRSMNTLSVHWPLPSMEMLMPRVLSSPVHAVAVNGVEHLRRAVTLDGLLKDRLRPNGMQQDTSDRHTTPGWAGAPPDGAAVAPPSAGPSPAPACGPVSAESQRSIVRISRVRLDQTSPPIHAQRSKALGHVSADRLRALTFLALPAGRDPSR